MAENFFLFEDSFINLNIDCEDVMISSFPNKIVMGKPSLCGYKKSDSFYFCIHEIKELFFALSVAIEYITFEKDDNNGTILQRNTPEVYEWEGSEITHGNLKDTGAAQQERKFTLCKRTNGKKTYEMLLTFHQTEILINILNDLILSAMCLKYSDRKLVEKFVDKKLYPSFDNKDTLITILLQENEIENMAARVDLMFYYKDILQLLVESNDLRVKLKHPHFFIQSLSSLSPKPLNLAQTQTKFSFNFYNIFRLGLAIEISVKASILY